jgi:hypothetical protein
VIAVVLKDLILQLLLLEEKERFINYWNTATPLS